MEICNSTDGWEGYFHENAGLRKAAPTSVNVTVGRRSRECLTEWEVERPTVFGEQPIERAFAHPLRRKIREPARHKRLPCDAGAMSAFPVRGRQ
jgi:hypothetical protein